MNEMPLLLAVTVPRKLHHWSFETEPHAAVMPTLIGGNTNAPAIMIGERCADFVRRA